MASLADPSVIFARLCSSASNVSFPTRCMTSVITLSIRRVCVVRVVEKLLRWRPAAAWWALLKSWVGVVSLRVGIDLVVVASSLGAGLWRSRAVFDIGVWYWRVLQPVVIASVAVAPASEVAVSSCDLAGSGLFLGVVWTLWFSGGGVDCAEA